MDINEVLKQIGEIMAILNVTTEAGQAFLVFVEFWLVVFSACFRMLAFPFRLIGWVIGRISG